MSWEYAFLDGIQLLRNPVLDQIVLFITSLGDRGLVWILLGSGLLFSKRYRMTGVMVLLSLALAHLLGNEWLKHIVERQRPFYERPDIALLIREGGYSFPSGHTASSFAAAGALYFRQKKAGIWALLLALLIGCSRLYLYVHFPTDVLAGMLLGIAAAWAVYQAEQYVRRKQTCQTS